MYERMRKKQGWLAWVLIAPALLIRAFSTAYPMFMTFYNSFFNLSYIKGNRGFIGFQNFINMFKDKVVMGSLEFTAIFTVVSMLFHVVLGILLAVMLNIPFRGKRLLRTVSLIPWAMPMVVVAQAARFLFNDQYGMINDLIRRLFASGFSFDWLVNRNAARAAVIMVDLWKDVPFFAILVLASLQFIPNEVYEASRIDGSGAVNSFFRITLPNISKTVLTISIFFTMWRLSSFDIVYGMTSGGPGGATNLLAYQISQVAFRKLDLGYASAMAVVMFLTMLVLAGINMSFARKIEE